MFKECDEAVIIRYGELSTGCCGGEVLGGRWSRDKNSRSHGSGSLSVPPHVTRFGPLGKRKARSRDKHFELPIVYHGTTLDPI